MKRTPLKSGKGFSKGNKSLKSGNALKSHKKLGFASNKKKDRERRKKEVYRAIDNSREHVCEGCNNGSRPLSHSHLVSVGHNNLLEAERRNIRLHCVSFDGIKGCHEKWEDGVLGEIDLMHDFRENMQIIKELDEDYYKKKYLSIYGRVPEEDS